MMKLRNLFNNFALAEMLVKNWDYDQDSLDLFQYFRISANAIYPFKQNGEVCYLRCCPTSEKQKENLLAELEFISFLRRRGFQAMQPLPSKTGAELVQKSTPWGDHFASVFRQVKGKQISKTGFDDEIIFAYGTALGQLHLISRDYTNPQTRRWTHSDVLNWIEAVLNELFPPEPLALKELKLLSEFFSSLPRHPSNYGLIHYDFETDNVFYDDTTKDCYVIDFDDAMYHWYVMDIVQALHSLDGEINAYELAHKQTAFLDGYRTQLAIDDELFTALPLFRRFANLYSYTRNKRCLQEGWDNEPGWMIDLRAKLTTACLKDAKYFGMPLQY